MRILDALQTDELCACNTCWWGDTLGLTLNDLKNSIPDFAKDVKLNFSSLIINSEYDEELVYGCAYASSLAIGDNHIASIFEEECRNRFGGEFIESVKATVISYVIK